MTGNFPARLVIQPWTFRITTFPSRTKSKKQVPRFLSKLGINCPILGPHGVSSKYSLLWPLFPYDRPWDWGPLVSNWEQSMVYTKSYSILCSKIIFIWTGLKVSSLASKCVIYRSEHNAKGWPHWKPWNANMKCTKG